MSRDPFLKISETFQARKAICETESSCFKKSDSKYVFKSSQNIIILKLGDLIKALAFSR